MLPEDRLKVVFIGDSGVGKTSILHRIQGYPFSGDVLSTVSGETFQISTTFSDGRRCDLTLWDTAGQEKFRSLAPLYFRGAACGVLVFDLTSRASFQSSAGWAAQLADPSRKILLIGNKSDAREARAVTFSEGEDCAAQIGAIAYLETSAKSGEGITEICALIVENSRERVAVPTPPRKIDPVSPKDRECC
jgi:Ras-related protein Rab-5C